MVWADNLVVSDLPMELPASEPGTTGLELLEPAEQEGLMDGEFEPDLAPQILFDARDPDEDEDEDEDDDFLFDDEEEDDEDLDEDDEFDDEFEEEEDDEADEDDDDDDDF